MSQLLASAQNDLDLQDEAWVVEAIDRFNQLFGLSLPHSYPVDIEPDRETYQERALNVFLTYDDVEFRIRPRLYIDYTVKAKKIITKEKGIFRKKEVEIVDWVSIKTPSDLITKGVVDGNT